MAVRFDETTKSFIDHAREEGLDYAAQNWETGDPELELLRKQYLNARRLFAEALGMQPRKE